MYSFNNRNDCTAVDEPFYAHYLQQTKLMHPGAEDILGEMSTDENQIADDLMNHKRKNKMLFIKNMAAHVALLKNKFYHKTTNVFLIRDTDAVIKSFSKVVPNVELIDIGIQQEVELYNELVQQGQKPPIIDSGELLKNPRKILNALCEHIDIPFTEEMLSWPIGPKAVDGIWAKYWYSSTHKSGSFQKQPARSVGEEAMPEQYLQLAKEAKKYYHELFINALKA